MNSITAEPTSDEFDRFVAHWRESGGETANFQSFSRTPRKRVREFLETLSSFGQARATEDGRYSAR